MDRLLIVMVGLPARGKSHVARRLARYLSWRGLPVRIFNVGQYRRQAVGGHQRHDWFSADNAEAKAVRQAIAMEALDDTLRHLHAHGGVAIYDATNTSRMRRQLVVSRCRERGFDLLFLEVICNDPRAIEENIESKLSLPDYVGMSPDAALADFRHRVEHYERAYEPVDDEDSAYVKLIEHGQKIVANRVEGPLARLSLRYVMNLRRRRLAVWITRHGRSEYNQRGLIGGDAALTEDGRAYAQALAEHVRTHEDEPMEVWTSTLLRTTQTAAPLRRPIVRKRRLDEIHAGICEGMSYPQIQAEMPEEFAARKLDKFRYRYPRGESYQDLIERLDEVVLELERQTRPTLIVGHQAVLRVLYAYLNGIDGERCPHISIPLHSLIKLTPVGHQVEEQHIELAELEPHGPASK